jgi:N6-adenosine-specific RNA methylase IME4
MKRYSVILADPPWLYGSRATHKKTKFGGGVHGHYPVMKTEDICALPVGRDYAANDCALFLWATGPHLKSGIEVIEAWGFRYVTIGFAWTKMTKDGTKPKFGPGYYTASNLEPVLLGIRGKMKPEFDDVAQTVLEPHPRGEDGKIIHSRKPVEIHRRIERLFGDVPRLEIFARVPEPGWDVIGNQLADGASELQPQRNLFDWHNQPIAIPKGA